MQATGSQTGSCKTEHKQRHSESRSKMDRQHGKGDENECS